MKTGYGIDSFRFSGSYVSRYHACPGSAVLEEAIPGFQSLGKERAASSLGTRLHKVFQRILEECEDWIEGAALLDALANVWGKARIELLVSEKAYLTWWILEMKNTTAPPVPFSIISLLHEVQPAWVEEDVETGAMTSHPEKEIQTSPKLIRFLADAVRYIYNLADLHEGAVVRTEDTRVAEWTQTKPKTSADVTINSPKRIDIVDLKTGTIPVEAFENEQLLYYLETYMEGTEVELYVHVIQPGNESVWEVPAEYLENWRESVLWAEQRILDGDRSLNPGKHCQFCPANPFTKGERGTPNCPAQVEVLFGAEDLTVILED